MEQTELLILLQTKTEHKYAIHCVPELILMLPECVQMYLISHTLHILIYFSFTGGL